MTLSGACSDVDFDHARDPARQATIAITSHPASAAVVIARDKGIFEKHGLDAHVVVYSSSEYAMRSMLDGDADFATAPEANLAAAALAGEKYSILATLARVESAGTIVVRRDRGIREASDLIGRRIGVASGTIGEWYLRVFLMTSRIPIDKVKVVPLLAYEVLPAIVSGDVDAVSTWFPVEHEVSQSLGNKAAQLSDPGLFTMSWSLITSPDSVRGDPETSERLLAALIEATAYLEADERRAQTFIAEQVGISPATLAGKWDDYRWFVRLDQSLLLELDDAARSLTGSEGGLPVFGDNIDSDILYSIAPDKVSLIEEPR